MHLLLVALALQLRTVAFAAPVTPHQSADALTDSVRAAKRARNEQASFERSRRAYLPGDPGADSLAAYYSGDAAHKPSAVCLVHGLEQCP